MEATLDRPELDGLLVPATVRDVLDEHVLLDLAGPGVGETGRAPIGDFRVARSDQPTVAPGDELEVLVEYKSGAYHVVSADKARRLAAFSAVEAAFRAGASVEAEVAGTMEGGFSVDVGVRAFLPASQVGLRPVRRAEELLGARFAVRIIRFDRGRQNVVVSRRVLLEAEREARLARLKVGAIVEGTIKNFTEFGAFVDVGGGVEGLLHIAEMSWSRIRRPEEVVRTGQRLRLEVIELDPSKNRISLSLRRLLDDPWLEVESKHPVGSVATGLVVSKTDFGCFLQLEPGLEGLIHSTGPLVGPKDQQILRRVDIGDEVSARVVDLDLEAKRLSLVLHHPEG